MKLEWNQQITAVLVAGRSNSYLVAINRNDLMLNIVTESNSDFVVTLQLDNYPTDFDSYEIFAEDTWTDSKDRLRALEKHVLTLYSQIKALSASTSSFIRLKTVVLARGTFWCNTSATTWTKIYNTTWPSSVHVRSDVIAFHTR